MQCTLVDSNPDLSASADQLLMQRVAARDRRAQHELAVRLVPRVRRLCRALLRDPHEAEDAAQQSLIEILQSARNFREPGNLEAWSDTVTARTTLRMSRRLRDKQSVVFQVAHPEHLANWVSDLRNRSVTPHQLQGYLERLTEPKRQAFVLKHGLDYTVEEIADVTETPVGTVKDRLVSARKTLRRLFQRDFDQRGRS